MKSRSYTEWLQDHGVVDRNENTNNAAKLRKEANINYLFNDEKTAKKFAKKFGLLVHPDRAAYQAQEDQLVFKDPVDGRYGVLITAAQRKELEKQYKESQADHLVDPQKLEEQIALIEKRIELLQSESFNKSAVARLNYLRKLASNIEEGWNSHIATSALHLSLQNYIAINMDILSETEIAKLKEACATIMDDNGDVAKGSIKPDANWWDYMRDSYPSAADREMLKQAILLDAKDLLHGNKKRRAINDQTPLRQPMHVEEKEEGHTQEMPSFPSSPPGIRGGEEKDKTKTREISRFLPDAMGASDTDSIYIDSGGMAGHRTVTKIWKRGVNKRGGPLSPGERPHHYQYFQTEYNAGAGLAWEVSPGLNRKTGKTTTGVAWAVSTKPILPKWEYDPNIQQGRKLKRHERPDPAIDVRKYNAVMESTLTDLIFSQRMITLYRKPELSNVIGDAKHASPKTQAEAAQWVKYRKKINSHLGDRVDYLSEKAPPQTSGNCTVMSLELTLDRKTRAEHWRSAKELSYPRTFQALTQKKAKLEEKLRQQAAQKEEVSFFDLIKAITEADVERVKTILMKNPALINEQDPHYRATPLINALVYYDQCKQQEPDALKKQSNYLAIANFLLSRKLINVNLQDKNGDTALHRAIYYAQKYNDQNLEALAKQIILQKADIDIQNYRGDRETPRSLIEANGMYNLGLLLKQFEQMAPQEKKDKPLPATAPLIPHPEQLNLTILLTKAMLAGEIEEAKKIIEKDATLFQENAKLLNNIVRPYGSLLISALTFANQKDITPEKRTQWHEFANWLLELENPSIELNRKDEEGNTALHHAAYAAYSAYAGSSPLEKNPFEEITKKLIQKGADANICQSSNPATTASYWIEEIPELKKFHKNKNHWVQQIKECSSELHGSGELKIFIENKLLQSLSAAKIGDFKEVENTLAFLREMDTLLLKDKCPRVQRQILEKNFKQILSSNNFLDLGWQAEMKGLGKRISDLSSIEQTGENFIKNKLISDLSIAGKDSNFHEVTKKISSLEQMRNSLLSSNENCPPELITIIQKKLEKAIRSENPNDFLELKDLQKNWQVLKDVYHAFKEIAVLQGADVTDDVKNEAGNLSKKLQSQLQDFLESGKYGQEATQSFIDTARSQLTQAQNSPQLQKYSTLQKAVRFVLLTLSKVGLGEVRQKATYRGQKSSRFGLLFQGKYTLSASTSKVDNTLNNLETATLSLPRNRKG